MRQRGGTRGAAAAAAGVGHGFGMRWSNSPAVAAWPEMFRDWLDALELLNAPPPASP